MTRFALVLAALILAPLACNLPKSKSFGEDQAVARSGASNGGADAGGTAGEGDGADSGGSSTGGRAGAGARESDSGADDSGAAGQGNGAGSGGSSTGGNADSGGSGATGGGVDAGGTVAAGGSVGTGAIPATGGGLVEDAGPDGDADAGIGPTEAGTGGVGGDAGAEAGGPPATTGTLVLGNLLPLAETGMFPQSMALGDLNADGHLDVVTANLTDPPKSLSVLLGRGDGTFAPKTDHEADDDPQQVALGDLNRDGKLDIVVVSCREWTNVPNALEVSLGNGDGTFAAKQVYATADCPQSLVLDDLDGDGNLDVVTTGLLASRVSVFLGKGDGTLSTRQDYATDAAPSALGLGDVNRDGQLDLVVMTSVGGAEASSSVNVLLGNGDGTFDDKTDFPAGIVGIYVRNPVVLGDLNGDGNPDVVAGAALGGPGAASVLLGNGDGTFAPPASLPDMAPRWIELFDVNHDGHLDLVAALDDRVSILFGQGDGTFPTRVDTPTGGTLRAMALGDLNGDSEPDLALTFGISSSSGLGVLLGTGGGQFASPAVLPAAGYPDCMAVGDVNDDGKLDIATASSAVDTVSVLLAEGDGRFAPRTDHATGDEPTSMALGDVDGDGKADVVTANRSANTVSVLLAAGPGTLAAKVDYATATRPTSVTLSDVNGDAQLDIVTTGDLSSAKGTVNVLLGAGDGTFAAHVDSQAGFNPTSLVLGDLNRDGRLDAVVANGDPQTSASPWSVGVLFGNGDGTFAAAPDVSTELATSLGLTDLNGDGLLDLLMASESGAGVRVLLGDGDGTFAPSVQVPTWSEVSSFALGDMNGDGTEDVVAASTTLDILFGNADGTFAPRVNYAAASSGAQALGDFDRDGRLDVATATEPSSVSVLLNKWR